MDARFDFEMNVPDGWCTRIVRFGCVEGVITYPAAEEGWTDPYELSVSFFVSREPIVTSLASYVRRTMHARVRQGFPCVLPRRVVDGRSVLRLSYTDGVRDIVTGFVSVTPGFAHEIDAAARFMSRDVDVDRVWEDLSVRIRWRHQAGGAAERGLG